VKIFSNTSTEMQSLKLDFLVS